MERISTSSRKIKNLKIMNKNKKNLNLLVVGVGSIGKRHINNLKYFNKNIDIVDVSKKRINECKNKFKFIKNSFLNYKDAIKQQNYDAIFICTPPHKHLEIAFYAAKIEYTFS